MPLWLTHFVKLSTTLLLLFVDNDLALASKVEPLEQVIDRLRDKLKDAHVKRLTNGTCTIELGFCIL